MSRWHERLLVNIDPVKPVSQQIGYICNGCGCRCTKSKPEMGLNGPIHQRGTTGTLCKSELASPKRLAELWDTGCRYSAVKSKTTSVSSLANGTLGLGTALGLQVLMKNPWKVTPWPFPRSLWRFCGQSTASIPVLAARCMSPTRTAKS